MKSRIRELREYLGLTQAAFGERVGVSRDVVNNLERGRVALTGIKAKAICTAFHVSFDWLMGEDCDMFASSEEAVVEELVRKMRLSDKQAQILRLFARMDEKKRELVAEAFFQLIETAREESCDGTIRQIPASRVKREDPVVPNTTEGCDT